ncbi:hypothetical protein [Massilia sp. TS11]|uniref:hypothetical protein n=1 Tax=Massilia sp. TS11 TaxID=2908003 RepID=UPI001EDAB7AD|nr:hypothetical protein [Massilia sp. TS11]MCG2584471.1 hypothetical protein [Massilia sp. TS11]
MDPADSDETLLDALSDGDLDAFQTLYQGHAAEMARLAAVRVADPAWVEAALRAAWAQLQHGRSRVQAGVALRLQLLRWVRDQLFEQLRQQQHLLDCEADPHGQRRLADLMLDSVGAPSARDGETDPWRRRLRSLPGEQREVLLLAAHGLSAADIAYVVDSTPSAAHAMLETAAHAWGLDDAAMLADGEHAAARALRGLPADAAPALAASIGRAMRFALRPTITTPRVPAPRPSRAWLWQLPLAVGSLVLIGALLSLWLTPDRENAGSAGVTAMAGAGLAGPGARNAAATAVGNGARGAEVSRQSTMLGGASGDGAGSGQIVREADVVEQGAAAGKTAGGGSRAGTEASVQVGALPSEAAWLDLIDALLQAGERREALAEWARFRAAYPKAKLPPALAKRLAAAAQP